MSDTALLVMDMQAMIVSRFAQNESFFAPFHAAIAAARAAEIPVIYVRIGFRPGAPEISPNNKAFSQSRVAQASAFGETPSSEIHPAIAPEPGDIVVTKRRVSAFSGSDLEVILRAQGISHLVLCGIATSGVVLSTLREAADKDYRLTVLSDCSIDIDEEVQRVLLTKVFPRQADVLLASEWQASLQAEKQQ